MPEDRTSAVIVNEQARASSLTSMIHFIGSHKSLFVILASMTPIMVIHLQNMWQRPQHQYFPIVLVTVGALLCNRIVRCPSDAPRRMHHWFSLSIFTVALTTLVFATQFIFSPWLSAFAFVLTCGAICIELTDDYHIRNILGIWCLLWLLVPLPGSYEEKLSSYLQQATTLVSSELLSFADVPNFADGATLVLPGRTLFVEQACTGIVSMMSVVTCCLTLAVCRDRGWLHAFLLCIFGLALVAATNVLRVAIIASAHVQSNYDLTIGWQHDFLGLVLFLIAIAFAISGDHMLNFFLRPVPKTFDDDGSSKSLWTISFNSVTSLGLVDEVSPDENHVRFNQAQRLTTPHDRVIAGVSVLFALFGLASISKIEMHQTGLKKKQASQTSFPEDIFPSQMGEWELVSFLKNREERLFAQTSRIWIFKRGNLTAAFSIDYSFDHWHRLHNCYTAIGWKQTAPPVVVDPKTTGQPEFLRARFTKGENLHGFLLYSLMEHTGESFPPPAVLSLPENFMRRIQKGKDTLYQTQIWVASQSKINGEIRRSVESLFCDLRQRAATKIGLENDSRSGTSVIE